MKDDDSVLFLENQLCFPLYAASRLTTKIYKPFLDKLDLTYPQYLVLLVLWQHKEMSVKAIGEMLYLESNTLTPLLKRLAQKGFIERNRSKEDERTVLISLTKKGQELKADSLCIPEKILDSFQDESISLTGLMDFQINLNKMVEVLSRKSLYEKSHDD